MWLWQPDDAAGSDNDLIHQNTESIGSRILHKCTTMLLKNLIIAHLHNIVQYTERNRERERESFWFTSAIFRSISCLESSLGALTTQNSFPSNILDTSLTSETSACLNCSATPLGLSIREVATLRLLEAGAISESSSKWEWVSLPEAT